MKIATTQDSSSPFKILLNLPPVEIFFINSKTKLAAASRSDISELYKREKNIVQKKDKLKYKHAQSRVYASNDIIFLPPENTGHYVGLEVPSLLW